MPGEHILDWRKRVKLHIMPSWQHHIRRNRLHQCFGMRVSVAATQPVATTAAAKSADQLCHRQQPERRAVFALCRLLRNSGNQHHSTAVPRGLIMPRRWLCRRERIHYQDRVLVRNLQRRRSFVVHDLYINVRTRLVPVRLRRCLCWLLRRMLE